MIEEQIIFKHGITKDEMREISIMLEKGEIKEIRIPEKVNYDYKIVLNVMFFYRCS